MSAVKEVAARRGCEKGEWGKENGGGGWVWGEGATDLAGL